MNERQIRQMIEFLNEVGNNHIYNVKDFSYRYTEWPMIRGELVRHKCLNEKDNAFNTKRMRE